MEGPTDKEGPAGCEDMGPGHVHEWACGGCGAEGGQARPGWDRFRADWARGGGDGAVRAQDSLSARELHAIAR